MNEDGQWADSTLWNGESSAVCPTQTVTRTDALAKRRVKWETVETHAFQALT